MGKINRFFKFLIRCFIKLYQYTIGLLIRPCCRYYPSCSNYALEAINHYGVLKGGLKAGWRLLRCHPWAPGGYDPLLPKKEKSLWIQDE